MQVESGPENEHKENENNELVIQSNLQVNFVLPLEETNLKE